MTDDDLIAYLTPEDRAWFDQHGGIGTATPVAPPLTGAQMDRVAWKHNAANRARWARPEVPYYEPPR